MDYRWIVVNSSGGKDSQTALRQTVASADKNGIPRDRIVVSHQCLGPSEWPGTLELARRQAEHYGLRFVVSRYRNVQGDSPDLLSYVQKRGKWPSNQQRYCTSDFKRGPGERVIRALYRESPGHILQVFGFRASESPSRAKKIPFTVNPRLTTKARTVHDWLPIHDWTDAQVWADIRSSGVPHHPAYDLGMPRLSCVFCIFAPRSALIIAGRANPQLLAEYVEVEKSTGHSFQQRQSLAEIQSAIHSGETPQQTSGDWNM